jgi:uncharacterized protein (TIGR02001 family)
VPHRAFVLWALLSATPACAQFSGSATLLSDYRYRGVSLSDGKPAVQLGAAHDWAGGLYAGMLASSVRFPGGGADVMLLPYLGYAHRVRPGLNWEVGAQYSHFIGACDRCYPELYAGLGSDHLGARVYYAPDYFGQAPALYAELNATRDLSARLRAVGHAGVLRSGGDDEGDDGGDRYRYDLRLGFVLTLRDCEMQLTWGTTRGGGDAYPPYPFRGDADRKDAWVLALSRKW